MHVNVANIHDPPAADRLPSVRQPLLLYELREKYVQMRAPALVELQHGDEGKRAAELARQEYAHFAPAVTDIAISTRAVLGGDFLRVKRQRRHALQLVFLRYLRETRAHTL